MTNLHTDETSKRAALQLLLLTAAPANDDGRKTLNALAERMGVSHQSISYWLSTGRVPARHATKLVEVSCGQVTLEEVLKFVI